MGEDYIGTGIAWGLTWGGDLEYLEEINKDLLKEDLSILMHGHRFLTAVEENHRNETETERIAICKNFHKLLSEKYDWTEVNANQEIEKVQAEILEKVKILL